jgi:hypothetical protein
MVTVLNEGGHIAEHMLLSVVVTGILIQVRPFGFYNVHASVNLRILGFHTTSGQYISIFFFIRKHQNMAGFHPTPS